MNLDCGKVADGDQFHGGASFGPSDSGVRTPPPDNGPEARRPRIQSAPAETGAGFCRPGWKFCLDLGFILVGLPFCFPVMLVTGAIIKVVSDGPIFYSQERVGARGRRFTCFKFRTMRTGAQKEIHEEHLPSLAASGAPMRKLDQDDPRVIPLGRWIRAAGFDELPQLWNIVRGEMSLVGPRPCAVYELPCFSGDGQVRFDVAPGLTGLWQVSGKNDTSFGEMIQLDLQYARRPSLALDLRILAKTPMVILRQIFSVRSPRSKPAPPWVVDPSSVERSQPHQRASDEAGVA